MPEDRKSGKRTSDRATGTGPAGETRNVQIGPAPNDARNGLERSKGSVGNRRTQHDERTGGHAGSVVRKHGSDIAGEPRQQMNEHHGCSREAMRTRRRVENANAIPKGSGDEGGTRTPDENRIELDADTATAGSPTDPKENRPVTAPEIDEEIGSPEAKTRSEEGEVELGSRHPGRQHLRNMTRNAPGGGLKTRSRKGTAEGSRGRTRRRPMERTVGHSVFLDLGRRQRRLRRKNIARLRPARSDDALSRSAAAGREGGFTGEIAAGMETGGADCAHIADARGEAAADGLAEKKRTADPEISANLIERKGERPGHVEANGMVEGLPGRVSGGTRRSPRRSHQSNSSGAPEAGSAPEPGREEAPDKEAEALVEDARERVRGIAGTAARARAA